MLKMSVNNVNKSHSTIPQHITHTPPMEKTEGFRGYFSINLNTWGIYSNFVPSFFTNYR